MTGTPRLSLQEFSAILTDALQEHFQPSTEFVDAGAASAIHIAVAEDLNDRGGTTMAQAVLRSLKEAMPALLTSRIYKNPAQYADLLDEIIQPSADNSVITIKAGMLYELAAASSSTQKITGDCGTFADVAKRSLMGFRRGHNQTAVDAMADDLDALGKELFGRPRRRTPDKGPGGGRGNA